ncbi:sulfite exporter TauE/SafE family protein [Pseudonocardia sp. C8]|nr:sulfite exporter TauE/SafE family protein [Pseudonocardia sp. C8]MBC3193426.1 sulfite exporter TauE/SafE family protein [Pseudonocardia sp. C8]
MAGALGLVVGLVIGTLGGGGGVLAVPALVYALGQDGRTATTGSIVVVGIISVVGVLARLRERTIDWRTGIAFGASGVPTAWAGTLLNRNVSQSVLLLSFSVLTVAVAVLMLFRSRSATGPGPEPGPPGPGGAGGSGTVTDAPPRRRTAVVRALRVGSAGAVVGFLAGFLGVGGGFLVVPALVVVLGMPMPAAIGTSLLVLTLNAVSSLAARAGDLEVDWRVLGPFVAVAVLGAMAGKLAGNRLSSASLHRGFALLLLLVGGAVGVESALGLGAAA